MWQTALVIATLILVTIYLVRHFTRVLRAEAPSCSACPGGCAPNTKSEATPGTCHSMQAGRNPAEGESGS